MQTPRTDRLLRRALAALAALVPLAAGAATIKNSAHDLGAGSTAVVKAASETDTCKFCHTPHGAQSTKLLWNHADTAQAVFNWGTDAFGNPVTATVAGTPLATSMRAESRRCLGCHDGSISIGDVSRAGSGNPDPIPMATVANRVDASGRMIGAGKVVGAGGNLAGQHPVGIPYAAQSGYNGYSSAVPPAQVTGAVKGGFWPVTTTGCGTPSRVCTTATGGIGVNGAAIYLVPNTAGQTTNVGIECTTCHEPHNSFGFAKLMRVDTAFDALCQSCHNK